MSGDAWIREIAAKFGLADQAGPLVEMLSKWLMEGNALDKFAQAGLSGKLESWRKGGDMTPLTEAEVVRVLGKPWVQGAASQLDTDEATIGQATAELLPRLFGELNLKASPAMSAAIPGNPNLSFLGSVPYVVTLAVAVLGIGFGMKGCGGVAEWKNPYAHEGGKDHGSKDHGAKDDHGHAKEEPVVAEKVPSELVLNFTGETLSVSGAMPDPATLAGVMEALSAKKPTGTIEIQDNRLPFSIENLSEVLSIVQGKNLKLSFLGTSLRIEGELENDAERDSLVRSLMSALKGTDVEFAGTVKNPGGLPTPGAPKAVAPRSNEAAAQALEKLGSSFSAEDLVKALNLTSINFATASSQVSADSMTILKRAAEAIKKAPAGTKIEVGGHTDNVGDAASNLSLSTQRAQAVVNRLASMGVNRAMLVSKGYGDKKPLVPNDSQAHRAQNRRMQFSVLK